jgi:hypothetical protein
MSKEDRLRRAINIIRSYRSVRQSIGIGSNGCEPKRRCFMIPPFDARQWLIDRKAEAQAELVRRQIQVEQESREREQRLARERVARLLTQAKMIERADRIRTYATAIVSRADRIRASAEQVAQWAAWARQEADRINPSLNGTLVAEIAVLPKTAAKSYPVRLSASFVAALRSQFRRDKA